MGRANNIIEGWGKSLGLQKVNNQNKKMSLSRMKICALCPFAKESSFLKIIRGNVESMAAYSCSKCGCPVNEKTLVINEKCPEGKW